MQNIIIICNSDHVLSTIERHATFNGFIATRLDKELQIHKDNSYIIVEDDDSISINCDASEINSYTEILGESPRNFFDMRFDDSNAAPGLILAISIHLNMAIDNDHGLIISGIDFANRHIRNRSWNWCISSC